MANKLPIMRQVRKWAAKHHHVFMDRGGYALKRYELSYWANDMGWSTIVTDSIKTFKIICATLMDTDGWGWRDNA